MNFLPKRIIAVFLAAIMLSGCSEIPDKSIVSSEKNETSDAIETTDADNTTAKSEQLLPTEYDIEEKHTSLKLNAEGGVFDGNVRTDGEFDGSGYVLLEQDMTLTHIADVPSSQHYRIVIAAYSYTGAAITLTAPEGCVGVYYIPKTDEPSFELYTIDSVYLPEGSSVISLALLDGYAAIDYFIVEDSDSVSDECYQVSASVVGKNTGIHTISTMKYMSDIYGVRIITAQNVTIGTNAELDAVYLETGRYPAMRCGDLMYSSLYADEEDKETAEEEIKLSLEWGESGGIVSLGWHWFAPCESENGLYKTGTDFDLSAAVTERDIALLSIEEIEGMYNSAMISEECYKLILDIDNISEILKQFKNKRITVVWQPLSDGDTNLYWWGGDKESYKWLWTLMFNRMNDYHELNNLIWVCNISSEDFYPGTNYCDIIGQGMYLNSNASFAARLTALSRLSSTEIKAVAITSCDTLPNPDFLYRDNAMWLWTAAANGKYTINSDGSYSEDYTDKKLLNNIYNSRLYVTKDELPDFTTYALITEDQETQETQ